MEEYKIVNMNNYPKFMEEWIKSDISIPKTLLSCGINASRVERTSPDGVIYRPHFTYSMSAIEYTWFVLRWS